MPPGPPPPPCSLSLFLSAFPCLGCLFVPFFACNSHSVLVQVNQKKGQRQPKPFNQLEACGSKSYVCIWPTAQSLWGGIWGNLSSKAWGKFPFWWPRWFSGVISPIRITWVWRVAGPSKNRCVQLLKTMRANACPWAKLLVKPSPSSNNTFCIFTFYHFLHKSTYLSLIVCFVCSPCPFLFLLNFFYSFYVLVLIEGSCSQSNTWSFYVFSSWSCNHSKYPYAYLYIHGMHLLNDGKLCP